ncbi:MAG TPA: MerR family transcriptional regulator [Chloroflexota bacterium]|jgi:MerR family transcriptional regulator/heat shock protein HspR|nr:MerR family transcriptional regulator [Chloroflexota bacterium]
MPREGQGRQTACFVISVAARLLNVHPQTLRYYERAGLIRPSRSKGNIRLYSPEDLQRAMQIKRLIEDLGVNLAGVEVIMRLTDRLRQQEAEIAELRQRLEACTAELRALRGK